MGARGKLADDQRLGEQARRRCAGAADWFWAQPDSAAAMPLAWKQPRALLSAGQRLAGVAHFHDRLAHLAGEAIERAPGSAAAWEALRKWQWGAMAIRLDDSCLWGLTLLFSGPRGAARLSALLGEPRQALGWEPMLCWGIACWLAEAPARAESHRERDRLDAFWEAFCAHPLASGNRGSGLDAFFYGEGFDEQESAIARCVRYFDDRWELTEEYLRCASVSPESSVGLLLRSQLGNEALGCARALAQSGYLDIGARLLKAESPERLGHSWRELGRQQFLAWLAAAPTGARAFHSQRHGPSEGGQHDLALWALSSPEGLGQAIAQARGRPSQRQAAKIARALIQELGSRMSSSARGALVAPALAALEATEIARALPEGRAEERGGARSL